MRLFNIRSIFLIILLVLSVALYFFTEARYAALLIILLLLIIISAFVIAFLTGRTLKVSMNAPVRGIQGELAHVAIKVENKGIFPIFLCRIVTILTNMLTDEKDEATHGLSVGRLSVRDMRRMSSCLPGTRAIGIGKKIVGYASCIETIPDCASH